MEFYGIAKTKKSLNIFFTTPKLYIYELELIYERESSYCNMYHKISYNKDFYYSENIESIIRDIKKKRN